MNNSRFKFRVWDSLINEYRKEGTIQLSGNGQPFIINGDMQPEDIDNVIIEQCTGLKDKHDKLIYEGDVVVGNWNTKLIVFWDAISASYMVKLLDNCGGDRELHYYSNMDGTLYYNFEIIGNIHEMELKK